MGFSTETRRPSSDIVLVDAQQHSVMNTSCHAALREPPEHIQADTIFITKSDGETAGLRARIRNTTPAPAHRVRPLAALFRDVFNPDQREQIGWLKGKKVATLSGIAQPESFGKACCNKAPILSTPSDSQIITGLTSRKF